MKIQERIIWPSPAPLCRRLGLYDTHNLKYKGNKYQCFSFSVLTWREPERKGSEGNLYLNPPPPPPLKKVRKRTYLFLTIGASYEEEQKKPMLPLEIFQKGNCPSWKYKINNGKCVPSSLPLSIWLSVSQPGRNPIAKSKAAINFFGGAN